MNDDDHIVTFEAYYDPMYAEIIRTKLQANGITCYIADSHMIWIRPYLNQALGGVKIKMFESDVERSKQLISQTLSLESDEDILSGTDAITCPYCGSSDIRYGSATQNRYPWHAIVIALLLMNYPFYANKAWHCFNCGRDFK